MRDPMVTKPSIVSIFLKFGITGLHIFLTIIIVLVSCRSDTEKVPENILQPEKMQQVMWDMLRADVFVRDYVKTDSLKLKTGFAMYGEILSRHDISQDQFRESFTYYRAHPDIFRVLLDSLEKNGKTELSNKPVPAPDTARRFRPFQKLDSNATE